MASVGGGDPVAGVEGESSVENSQARGAIQGVELVTLEGEGVLIW